MSVIFKTGDTVNVLCNGRRYPGAVVSYDIAQDEYVVQLKANQIRTSGMWVIARKVRAS